MQENIMPILYWAESCRFCKAVIALLDGLKYSYKKVEVRENLKKEGWDAEDAFIEKDDLDRVPALYLPESKTLAYGYRIADVIQNG